MKHLPQALCPAVIYILWVCFISCQRHNSLIVWYSTGGTEEEEDNEEEEEEEEGRKNRLHGQGAFRNVSRGNSIGISDRSFTI